MSVRFVVWVKEPEEAVTVTVYVPAGVALLGGGGGGGAMDEPPPPQPLINASTVRRTPTESRENERRLKRGRLASKKATIANAATSSEIG